MGQKRVSDPLELESQAVLNNLTWVLWKATRPLNLSSPSFDFFFLKRSILICMEKYFIVILWISLISSNVEQSSIYPYIFCVAPLEKCC